MKKFVPLVIGGNVSSWLNTFWMIRRIHVKISNRGKDDRSPRETLWDRPSWHSVRPPAVPPTSSHPFSHFPEPRSFNSSSSTSSNPYLFISLFPSSSSFPPGSEVGSLTGRVIMPRFNGCGSVWKAGSIDLIFQRTYYHIAVHRGISTYDTQSNKKWSCIIWYIFI